MDDPNLVNFSDELLISIFQYVSSSDLYNLSKTCTRFNDVVKDKYLWFWCEGRAAPNSKEKVSYCVDNIHHKTQGVLFSAKDPLDYIITPDHFNKIRALSGLTVLALENMQLLGCWLELKFFPPTLKELSLRYTYLYEPENFFRRSANVLQNLRVLCLDGCKWVEAYSLMALSKMPKLEILSLYLCKQLVDNDVCYISLSGRFGFKSLKILDLRFTSFGNEILRTFYRNSTISEIYFQSYAKTYHSDVTKRRLEVLNGSPQVPFSTYQEIIIDDGNPDSFEACFASPVPLRKVNPQYLNAVSDNGIKNFRHMRANVIDYVPPESILYTRPYKKCKCGSSKSNGLKSKNRRDPQFKEERDRLVKYLKSISSRPTEIYQIDPDGLPRLENFMLGTRPVRNMSEWFILDFVVPRQWQNIPLLLGHSRPHSTIIEVSLGRDTIQHRVLPTLQTNEIVPGGIGQGDSERVNSSTNEEGCSSGNVVAHLEENNQWTCSKESGAKPSTSCISSTDLNSSAETKIDSDTENVSSVSKIVKETTKRRLMEPDVEPKSPPPTKKIKLNDVEGSSNSDESHTFNKNKPFDSWVIKSLLDVKKPTSTSKQTEEIYRDLVPARFEAQDALSPSNEDQVTITRVPNESNSMGSGISNLEGMSDAATQYEPTTTLPMVAYSPLNSTDNSPVSSPSPSSSSSSNNEDPTGNNSSAVASGTARPRLNIEVIHPIHYIPNNANLIRDDDPDYIRPAELFGGNVLAFLSRVGDIRILLPDRGQDVTTMKFLSLRGFELVTDESLRSLQSLQLELLDVSYTSVTPAGLKRFAAKNPQCRVVHETMCRCLPNMHF